MTGLEGVDPNVGTKSELVTDLRNGASIVPATAVDERIDEN